MEKKKKRGIFSRKRSDEKLARLANPLELKENMDVSEENTKVSRGDMFELATELMNQPELVRDCIMKWTSLLNREKDDSYYITKSLLSAADRERRNHDDSYDSHNLFIYEKDHGKQSLPENYIKYVAFLTSIDCTLNGVVGHPERRINGAEIKDKLIAKLRDVALNKPDEFFTGTFGDKLPNWEKTLDGDSSLNDVFSKLMAMNQGKE